MGSGVSTIRRGTCPSTAICVGVGDWKTAIKSSFSKGIAEITVAGRVIPHNHRIRKPTTASRSFTPALRLTSHMAEPRRLFARFSVVRGLVGSFALGLTGGRTRTASFGLKGGSAAIAPASSRSLSALLMARTKRGYLCASSSKSSLPRAQSCRSLAARAVSGRGLPVSKAVSPTRRPAASCATAPRPSAVTVRTSTWPDSMKYILSPESPWENSTSPDATSTGCSRRVTSSSSV